MSRQGMPIPKVGTVFSDLQDPFITGETNMTDLTKNRFSSLQVSLISLRINFNSSRNVSDKEGA